MAAPASPVVSVPANRFSYGDYVRVFATIAVVAQHMAHRTTLFGLPDAGSTSWWTIMSIEAMCRWAVPLFVMLSGALLLDPQRNETARDFYRKRLWRVGLPLLFWSAFYLLPGLVARGFSDTALADAGTRLLYGRPAYHMYFLFVIAALYLVTPWLRDIVRGLSGAELRRAWIVLLLLACVMQSLFIYSGYSQTIFAEVVPYVAYYLAGYDLRRQQVSRRGMSIAWAAVAMATAAMVLVTVPLVDRFGISGRTRYLYEYFSPTVIVVGVSLFLIFVNAFDRPRDSALARWVARVSPATFGIFLMHPALFMAVQAAQKHGLMPVWNWTAFSTLAATAVLLSVSWAVTAVWQRIPLLRSLVG
jgi:surface polysaccharide O-acyltransferase-like enzyme